ncbi:MAG: hypothetical protein N2259_02420 [Patescibacteria group bacterium]|nr:hypothetical protein [Patescibacteria group bacterium]
MKKILFVISLSSFLFSFFLPFYSQANEPIFIHLFTLPSCPHCQEIKPFVKAMAEKYNIIFEEHSLTEELSVKLYDKLRELYKIKMAVVPVLFVGHQYFIGSTAIRNNLEKTIQECLKDPNYTCPVHQIEQTLLQMPKPKEIVPVKSDQTKINFLGKEITFSLKKSTLFLGMILGLIDGINPCLLMVFLFLLTYLLAIGSKKRAIGLGLVFVLTVFIVYFLFMYGIFNLFHFIGLISTVKMIIGFLALIVALLMLKDFFFYNKFVSLEIPTKSRFVIQKLIQKGTMPSAIILAFFSSLVELPCSSGIPLVYVTILAERTKYIFPYLFWYNFFFIVPLLLMMALVSVAIEKADQMEVWRAKFKKYMRLASGLILLILALGLLLKWF